MNREVFFSHVRAKPFAGALMQGQVDGMTRILDEWERRGRFDVRWLAYLLATTYHETAHTMQPVREYGGEAYLRSKAYYPWVGEGLVQITWASNHKKFGATAPGQMLTWPIALKALFDGCIKGMFTGKKLSDYFNATTNDPINARRVVNGVDKAGLIYTYHNSFLKALQAALVATMTPAKPEPAKPKVTKETAAGTAGGAIVTGTVVTGAQQGWGFSEWAIAIGVLIALGFAGYVLWAHWQKRKAKQEEVREEGVSAVEYELLAPPGYEKRVPTIAAPDAVGIAAPILSVESQKAASRPKLARKPRRAVKAGRTKKRAS